jgi:hypothetical protein
VTSQIYKQSQDSRARECIPTRILKTEKKERERKQDLASSLRKLIKPEIYANHANPVLAR